MAHSVKQVKGWPRVCCQCEPRPGTYIVGNVPAGLALAPKTKRACTLCFFLRRAARPLPPRGTPNFARGQLSFLGWSRATPGRVAAFGVADAYPDLRRTAERLTRDLVALQLGFAHLDHELEEAGE